MEVILQPGTRFKIIEAKKERIGSCYKWVVDIEVIDQDLSKPLQTLNEVKNRLKQMFGGQSP